MKLSEVTHWDPIEDPMKFYDVLRLPEVIMRLQRLNRLATTTNLAQSNPVRWQQCEEHRPENSVLNHIGCLQSGGAQERSTGRWSYSVHWQPLAIMSEAAAGHINQWVGSQAVSASP